MYYAIIGDIINSRAINNRREFQNSFMSSLTEVNDKYCYDIASNFTITLGDEFQGLLKKPDNIIDIIEDIKKKVYPVRIRFGIGIGDIYTDINHELALGADGPAYIFARKMIEEIRQGEKSYEPFVQEVKVCGIQDDTREILINTIFSLWTVIEKSWTPSQREKIYSYMENKTQRKTAAKLGIYQPAIHMSFQRANFYSYQNASQILRNALKTIEGNYDR